MYWDNKYPQSCGSPARMKTKEWLVGREPAMVTAGARGRVLSRRGIRVDSGTLVVV